MNDITVIVPVFNEENGLINFFTALAGVLKPLNLPYEILFINDGSTDGTLIFRHKEIIPYMTVSNGNFLNL